MNSDDADEQQLDDNPQELQDLLDSLLETPSTFDNISAEEVYVNSCEECAQKQRDELDVLAAVYGDDFKQLPAKEGGDIMIDIKIQNLFAGNKSHSFLLSVNIPASYPNVPPLFDIHMLSFKSDQIGTLWQNIIELGEDKLGQPMLYDMTCYCQEFLANLQLPKEAPPKKEIEEKKEEAEEVEEVEKAYSAEDKRVYYGTEVKNYFRGSDLFDAIRAFEGTQYRVVRVENIRNVHREEAFKKLCKRQAPMWVWHGTNLANIPSIVARGLLAGGSSGIAISNGDAYGRGVYLALSPMLSLSYTRGASENGVMRLLLCSLIANTTGGHLSAYDWGFVCKSGSLILPSYAVDVVLDREYRSNGNPEPVQPKLHTLMENSFDTLKGQEKLDTMTAYASRHLPFGFGSASGSSFQVLEVAPHDDDDDDATYSESIYSEEESLNISYRSSYESEIHMTPQEWEAMHRTKGEQEREEREKREQQKNAKKNKNKNKSKR